MSWQILVAISVILYSVSVLLQRLLLKDDKSEPISFSVFFQVGVAVVIGILVVFLQGSQSPFLTFLKFHGVFSL